MPDIGTACAMAGYLHQFRDRPGCGEAVPGPAAPRMRRAAATFAGMPSGDLIGADALLAYAIMTLRLAELTPDNVAAACRIEVKSEQQKFVAPVAESIAEAYVHYGTAWPRLILDGDRVVGFVMGGFDPESEIDAFRAGIWRLNVAASEQGRGYGRFAVEAIAAEARRRGRNRITVLWIQGDGSPEGFYLHLGFTPTGEVIGGEIVGERIL